MFSISKQTHAPTGVEHSLTCNFFNRTEKSLLVAGSNVLRVFRLIPDVDPKKRERYGEGRPPKMKLECMASFTLCGNITSLASATLAGASRDALLLSFRDAKLSLVEYDPDTHDLRTLSLHYFEEEEMRGGWTHNEHRMPLLRVDPEGRCAVMLGYGRRLIVLPFRRDPAPEDTDLLLVPSALSSLQADIKPLPHQLLSGSSHSSNKAPVLASYSIALKELDEKMDNVIDIQFLHGYYEPTLLILYEPIRTFPGRLAVRRDTCAMVAISLSLATRVHPSIWSVSGLPFDCLQAVPVRRPLGGTLLLATNSVLYLNQSVPPYGVAVNSVADISTNFPLKEQPGLKITLEGAQACFLSNDRLVLSLHGGELYVLSLLADSMRSVRGFHFEKAAASVLTTCISVYEDNHLFLGSRLGNSLLLRFIQKDQAPVINVNGSGDDDDDDDIVEIPQEDNNSEPPNKKKKHMDSLGDCMASNVAEIRDPDELEVYGREDKAAVQITSFSFEVCDSLLNIGPCGNVSIGEPAFLSEEFTSSTDPDLELVTTAGHGKNGALCVLQRSLRPQIATTFELPSVKDMWTVAAPPKQDDSQSDRDSGSKSEQDTMHAFLVLSREDSTMVLQTGQEINEVDSSGFSTQNSTVFAGNLGLNKYIIQVCQMGVRLLLGIELLQHIPLDLGSPVVHASCADPYVVLLCGDGQVIQLTLKEARLASAARLVVTRPSISLKSQITALCVYRDVSGLFSGHVPGAEHDLASDNATEMEGTLKPEHIKREVDDEDELLYGDSEFPIMLEPPVPEPSTEPIKIAPWWQRYMKDVKPTYWLLLARENGTMEIYSLPDCRLSFLVRNVSSGPRVLTDNLELTPLTASSANAPDMPIPRVQELMVAPLGHLGNRPLLLIRLDDEVLVYQAFHYPKGSPMPLRFRRLAHTMLTKERKPKTRKKQAENTEANQESTNTPASPAVCQLRYFRNIAGYNGVFVCGPSPHWIFLTFRGELRTHTMPIDGPIPCFAPFHNVNCSQGFLYFNMRSELRICVLPTHLSYDAPWPCRKVPLRCTPHFVSYHLESKTYCIVTSTSEASNNVYKFNGEDKELSVEKRNDRFPFPFVQRFSIMLFSPVSWEVIPNTSMELDEWEHVTCLKNVSLAYEGTHSGLKGYIAVGTNYSYGEDITSRGRILIYDVIEVVPEPGQPLTKNRFKAIYAKEQKGPVTALTHAMGYLISAVGQKVYIWQLKDNDLVGVAFIDTQVYIHQMLSINSLILVADVYKSISLLRFQEEYRTLSLVSRDFRPAEVYTTEFVIDNSQIGFLVSDREKNVVLYMYQPESRESFGGQRLLRKADFHIGQHINTFFRLRCRMQPENSLERRFPAGSEKRHLTMFATLDGGLGYILPLPEKTYRRLLMLQNVLVNQVCHTAGLNPKAFRTFKSATRLLGNAARGIVDGELVWTFLNLPANERWEIAKKIGTKVDDIVDDLLDIERLAAHF